MPLGRISYGDFGERAILFGDFKPGFPSHGKSVLTEKKRCLVCVSAYKGPNVPWCLVGPLDGRLVSHGPSHRRTCLSGYTDLGMETGLVRALRSRVFLVEHRTFDMSARDERRMWITCRWLNLSVN
jgi:hypothetical protein